jgi:competence protein ComFC
MATIGPTRIPGRWRSGYALDFHTVNSVFVGYDEFGHPQFDTKRSEVGELLYRLKYKADRSVIPELTEAAASFITNRIPEAEVIVAVPPSKLRSFQPVDLLAEALSKRLSIPFAANCIQKQKEVSELKNVFDYEKRLRLLEGAYTLAEVQLEGRKVLLIDDLYRSGATMSAIAEILYEQGGVSDVFALTITRTRSNS